MSFERFEKTGPFNGSKPGKLPFLPSFERFERGALFKASKKRRFSAALNL